MYIMFFSEATCRNKYFKKPTRSEFQRQIREALRTAKERCRSKRRGPRSRAADPRIRTFWNEEEELEQSRESSTND